MRNYLKSFDLLTDEEVETFVQMTRPKSLKKGDFFVKEGTTSNEIAFVVSGTLRSFYYSSNSDEITYCLTTKEAPGREGRTEGWPFEQEEDHTFPFK